MSKLQKLASNVVATFGALLGLAHTAFATDEPEYGHFFCHVDHAVIAARIDKSGTAYDGEVNLPEDRRRFYMTIRAIGRDPITLKLCRDSVATYMGMMERGEKYPLSDPISPKVNVFTREQMGRHCFARDEAIMRDGGDNFKETVTSYEMRFQFYGLQPENWLIIYKDDGFIRGRVFDHGPVVERGTCERID